jgi:peptidoglycan/xylan/chitin deacetylase (PgdA/CDA1 family)
MMKTLGLEYATLTTIQPSPGADGNISGYSFPERTWALTYDDGPSPRHTLPILDILQRFSVKATFFWVAQNLPGREEIVDKVKAGGMALANHSYTHANLPRLDAAALRKEVVASTDLQEQVYGERPRFFRCPYGAGLNNALIRRLIADTGMIHVFWNVDSLDWQDKDPASILARVKAQMAKEKKGVILFHDIHAQTVETSKLLLEYSAGLDGGPQAHRWVTLPQIVEELNSRKAR